MHVINSVTSYDMSAVCAAPGSPVVGAVNCAANEGQRIDVGAQLPRDCEYVKFSRGEIN